MNNNQKEITPKPKASRGFRGYRPRKKPAGDGAQPIAQPITQPIAQPIGEQGAAHVVAETEVKGLKTFAEQKSTKTVQSIIDTAKKAMPKGPKKPEEQAKPQPKPPQQRPGGDSKPLADNQPKQADGKVQNQQPKQHPAADKAQEPKKQGKQPRPPKENTGGGKKLKVIPLGGIMEIGKNMTVFEYENDIIVVDCGMTFPNDEMLGVDLVIPDITYLRKNISKVRAFVITHGHEDHIGGLPYILRDLNVPIYCTGLAAGIVKNKLSEHKNLRKPKIQVKKAGDTFKIGCFEVEMIHVNHSIADSVALHIKCPVANCLVTGDFKIDTTPVDGKFIDLARIGELGKNGLTLLMSDSTNAEKSGMSMSESRVGVGLEAQFKNCDRRILVASFSSNVHRIQQIVNISAKYGRKVCVSGRSLENMVRVAGELGYLKIPDGTLIDLSLMKKYPKEQITIITTGSQGEPMSALMRMSTGAHKQVHISAEDRILIAAHPIPGNEKSVYNLINELCKRGAEVIYDKAAEIHASGHACGEELKIILALARPKFFMPTHGEYRHLTAHKKLALDVGVPKENIFISELGRVLEINNNSARLTTSVPSGKVLVDGIGVGDVGQTVLRDRQHLSQDGLIIIVTTFDGDTATVAAGPDIICRGINLTKDTEDISDHVRTIAADTIESCLERNLSDWATIKSELRAKISDYVYKQTKRNPMILPINMEV